MVSFFLGCHAAVDVLLQHASLCVNTVEESVEAATASSQAAAPEKYPSAAAAALSPCVRISVAEMLDTLELAAAVVADSAIKDAQQHYRHQLESGARPYCPPLRFASDNAPFPTRFLRADSVATQLRVALSLSVDVGLARALTSLVELLQHKGCTRLRLLMLRNAMEECAAAAHRARASKQKTGTPPQHILPAACFGVCSSFSPLAHDSDLLRVCIAAWSCRCHLLHPGMQVGSGARTRWREPQRHVLCVSANLPDAERTRLLHSYAWCTLAAHLCLAQHTLKDQAAHLLECFLLSVAGVGPLCEPVAPQSTSAASAFEDLYTEDELLAAVCGGRLSAPSPRPASFAADLSLTAAEALMDMIRACATETVAGETAARVHDLLTES